MCQNEFYFEFESIIIDINKFESHPCLNGGTCMDLVSGYKCWCFPEFIGVNCKTGTRGGSGMGEGRGFRPSGAVIQVQEVFFSEGMGALGVLKSFYTLCHTYIHV